MIEPITGYTVTCDLCGEDLESEGYRLVFDSESEARNVCKESGWREVEYGKYACVNCQETLNEEEL